MQTLLGDMETAQGPFQTRLPRTRSRWPVSPALPDSALQFPRVGEATHVKKSSLIQLVFIMGQFSSFHVVDFEEHCFKLRNAALQFITFKY